MARIENEIQYNATMKRIEELWQLVDEETPIDDKNSIELELLSKLIADYENEHYPIKSPSLQDVLKLRMYEMDLTQKELAVKVGVSPSRISEYMTGKSEPTLAVARTIVRELSVSPSVVLGLG